MPSNNYYRNASNEQRKKMLKRLILELLITTILVLLAISLTSSLQGLIKKKILEKVKLEPNSEGYNNWLDPPISTVRSYYLFNITNPTEIALDPKDTTIKFEDTPPYTYNIKTKKINVEWLNDNTEISYAVERLYTRDPEQFQESSLNDTGNFLDLVRANFRTQFGPKPTPAFYAIAQYEPFYYRNAVEQLEGFTSGVFNAVRDKMMGPNTDKFGFVYRQNGSRLYNVSIKADLMRKGQVNTFNNELIRFNIDSSDHYPFPVYDSLTYPPMLFDKPLLNIFNSDFCLPIVMQYNGTITKFGGIQMFKYIVKFIDLNNCTNPNDTSTCVDVETLDVSKCVSDSLPDKTLFLSKAHFYGSSQKKIEDMNVEGFAPTEEKHDSILLFEPYSGTPFEAVYRMQLNIDATLDPMKQSYDGPQLEPDPKKKGVKRLIPIFWIDQKINIHPKIIKKLRIPLLILRFGRAITIPVAILLSLVIILIIELAAKFSSKKIQYAGGSYMRTQS